MNSAKILTLLAALICVLAAISMPCESAEVIIVGDTQLKPVADVVKAIREALPGESVVYALADVRGRLRAVVRDEDARLVVALGKDALDMALTLPESIPVVYGLLITPSKTPRNNTTGVYMETPASEYLSLMSKYFPGIRKIAIIYGTETEMLIDPQSTLHMRAYRAKNSYELINTVTQIQDVQALLLLPDRNLFSVAAMESIYLSSFRKKVPLLGISERFVREGSLLALVFDIKDMGRQIGELVRVVYINGAAAGMAPSPPRKFNLYLNTETAKRMGIAVPEELVRKAKRIYP